MLGLLINPCFPANLKFIAGHIAPKVGPATTAVGNEWSPYRTWTLIENSGVALSAFLLAVLARGAGGPQFAGWAGPHSGIWHDATFFTPLCGVLSAFCPHFLAFSAAPQLRDWQVQWKRRRTLAQTFSTTISRRSGCRLRLGRSVPGQICGHLCLALNQSYPFRLRGWRWQWVVTELRQVMLDATGAGVSRFTVSMDNGFAFLVADEAVLVSDEPYRSKEQYQQRNRWMVDLCDCLVAAYAGVKQTATYATIRYAQSQGRDVLLATVKREQRRIREGKKVR